MLLVPGKVDLAIRRVEQVQRRVRGQRGGQAALAVGPVGIQDDHLQEAVSLVILNQQHQAAGLQIGGKHRACDREAAGVECIVRQKGIAPAAGVDEIGDGLRLQPGQQRFRQRHGHGIRHGFALQRQRGAADGQHPVRNAQIGRIDPCAGIVWIIALQRIARKSVLHVMLQQPLPRLRLRGRGGMPPKIPDPGTQCVARVHAHHGPRAALVIAEPCALHDHLTGIAFGIIPAADLKPLSVVVVGKPRAVSADDVKTQIIRPCGTVRADLSLPVALKAQVHMARHG